MIERERLQVLLAEACSLKEVTCDPGLGQEWVVSLPAGAILAAIQSLRALPEWQHLSTITGLATDEGVELLYHCWLGRGVTLRVRLPREQAEAPSLTPQLPGAGWYEREIQEMLGVSFHGLPEAPPLLLNETWDAPPPLAGERRGADVPAPTREASAMQGGGRQGPTQQAGTPPDVRPRSGAVVEREPARTVRLPIGPQHPLLKEPLSLQVDMAGEQIVEASVRIGYVHRGIEELAHRRTYVQNIHLIERLCGICSHIHSTTYCQAVETLLRIEVSPRAQAIRVLLCEMERIHSHLLWIGVLGEAIGFTTIFMYAWRDRELALDAMERLSGGRVSHAANVIGGVRVGLGAEESAQLKRTLDTLESRLSLYQDLMVHDRHFRLRTQGIGRLSLEEVQALNMVGPTARASGVDVDMRRDAPYAGYADLAFQVVVGADGDVWARADVRQREIAESISLCRQVIEGLPEGALAVRAPARVPEGEVVVRSEAPRGELLYYLRSDGSNQPARLKVRAPTLPALMGLAGLLRGAQTADLPVVIAGFDLCIACADR